MADAFHEFEHAGWERAAAAYGDAFGPLTMQAAAPLLEAVAAGPGVRVLDLATGPGYVAGAAAARGASVVGLDFAAAMVEHARRAYPAVEFRQGDTTALPFEAASFDAVVMSFGILHLAEPERALAEMRRVLRPHGRAAFSVWATPDKAVGFRIVLDAIAAHGSAPSPAPDGPPFFRFSDLAESRRALLEAGFSSPAAEEVPMRWRLPSADALFAAMSKGGVRTGALLNAQPPEAREAIRAAIAKACEPFARGGSIELPMPCVVASARR